MRNTDNEFKDLFSKDNRTSMDAIDRAQFIAFSPYIWEATKLLIETGILREIDASKNNGISFESLVEKIDFPPYGIRILLEASLGIELTYLKENKYRLAKTGYFLLHNEMTRVNYNFMKDVCEPGFGTIKESIEKEKPVGLKAFGDWPTIYQALSQLNPEVQKSWFAFDHFYSDRSFNEILEVLDKYPINSLMDIGGNTGKWTKAILSKNPQKKLGFVDLPGQINIAKQELKDFTHYDRIAWYPTDMLEKSNSLPKNFDAIWMSQFLDCFSDEQIISILKKCHEALDDDAYVFINETFWDRQEFKTSAFSLQMTSFYFTTMANGNSQMYDSKVFFKLIDKAGFKIEEIHDLLGHSHTLLILKKK